MLRLAADHNFDRHNVRELVRRTPHLDIVHIGDVGLARATDERVDGGLSMPGVVEVSRSVPIHQAIEDLLVLVECSLVSGRAACRRSSPRASWP
ncbi:MAG TPA: hypothetical protein VHL09_07525 [Dehalococcoidia bacterium]|nr:hypothetical protein [Dehalococcoidia bacterium]